MGLVSTVIRWLVQRPEGDLEADFDPGPLAHEVEQRQDRLERVLEERRIRREIVRAQVRAIRGGT